MSPKHEPPSTLDRTLELLEVLQQIIHDAGCKIVPRDDDSGG